MTAAMRRRARWIVPPLVVLAALAAGQIARAQSDAARVRSLYLATTAAATPPAVEPTEPLRFDEGTKRVFARFAYDQAADQEIRLVVQGRGGVQSFSHTARYTGDGMATIEIDGTAVFGVLANGLALDARDAKQSAKQAAERTIGVQEFLRAAEAAVLRLQWTSALMAGIDLPPTLATTLNGIDSRLGNAVSILNRAIELPSDDIEGKQRRAAQVDTLLGEVVVAATDLNARAPELRDLPLPRTGHRPADAFVVQVEVAGDIAVTAEFWVWGPARIQLPILSKGAVLRSR